MSNHETMKEYGKLVDGFLEKNPIYDIGDALSTVALDELQDFPYLKECSSAIVGISFRANFVIGALLMEMDRDRFPLEKNLAEDFNAYWQVASTITMDYFVESITHGKAIRSLDELGEKFMEKTEQMTMTFLSIRKANDYHDMKKWLEKVYSVYESKMVFG